MIKQKKITMDTEKLCNYFYKKKKTLAPVSFNPEKVGVNSVSLSPTFSLTTASVIITEVFKNKYKLFFLLVSKKKSKNKKISSYTSFIFYFYFLMVAHFNLKLFVVCFCLFFCILSICVITLVYLHLHHYLMLGHCIRALQAKPSGKGKLFSLK